jgi:hypothetical protein
MQTGLDPFRFVIIAVAGWMNQHQQHPIVSVDQTLKEIGILDVSCAKICGRIWEFLWQKGTVQDYEAEPRLPSNR